MRRKRARAVGSQVSLFPFLAVLICTMGVLIVLLVLVVKQADRAAQRNKQASAEELAQRLEELRFEAQAAEFRVNELTDFRPQALKDLQQHKLRRSHLEDHQRKLLAELDALQQKWQAMAASDSSQAASQVDELASIKAELGELQDRLAQERERAAQRRSRTAVVAYDGRSGTRRRPIYIECTPTGIDLQPFAIHLTADDFTEPILPGNPLDAAILAIRERWLDQDPGQAQGAPYPLILVRPGGSLAYAIVREAMKSWDSEFGHQIVPQALDLDFPPEDPSLGRELQEVVAIAKLRQARINASVATLSDRMRGGAGGNSPGGLGGTSLGSGREAGSGTGTPNSGYGSSADGDVVLRASGRGGGFVAQGASPGFSGRGRASATERSPSDSGSSADGTPARQASQSRSTQLQSGANGQLQNSGNGQASQVDTGQGGQGNAGQIGNTGLSAPSRSSAGGSGTAALSEARGENWALPTRTAGATAFRRPIRVTCQANRMILQGSRVERQQDTVLDYQPDVKSVMDPMVEAIWNRIDSWGVAGFNSYWKPELRVTVLPGGEDAFRQLQDLLVDSGLGVEEERP